MQVPSKGQPIDSKYITDIVNAINAIQTQISSRSSRSVVSSSSTGNQTAKTSDLIVAAGFEKVINTTATTITEVSQTHQFGVTFQYPPIVTATPQIVDTTLANKTVTVYIKDITTSSATIVVKFSTTDSASVGVNIIAVGLPAS